MIQKILKISFLSLFLLFISCGDDAVPKPKSHLSLEYPRSKYSELDSDCLFTFEKNDLTTIKNKSCSFEINYPKMKATIYITHKSVNNDIDKLLRDAQTLTYNHVVKADDIIEQPFINDNKKVYGMFYEVGGNAATNAQFYATDSTKNFIVGSVYFYAKPNFDSIYPAAQYLKEDMKRIMETLEWK
ncbi:MULTISPECIES: gliding motility lipoprotein GldD [unclassified Flavobacterium]|nr:MULTISPECIES: gliding motility lipoprotein GldD [unclassified Flavobacterium]MDP5000897.1 gliding motility lipoprotein GldD [Flavobacterium sp.]MDP5028515.1 gliding motility lipoprotein GldD [Flavobacterium sp.]MDP5097200.1 gliding motility lipoprotein GldD [Flavobacterium sp.]MQP52714.1 gliding motility lipoprotein GldD [Flavobacterium sp. LMO9]MQP62106.1 gliding motility lipoprotein GldD [Flavobacterium sp. LMO6]